MTDYTSQLPVVREFGDAGQARLRVRDRFFVERQDWFPWMNSMEGSVSGRTRRSPKARNTELTVTSGGSLLKTDWTTLYRQETQNDWGDVFNVYLAG